MKTSLTYICILFFLSINTIPNLGAQTEETVIQQALIEANQALSDSDQMKREEGLTHFVYTLNHYVGPKINPYRQSKEIIENKLTPEEEAQTITLLEKAINDTNTNIQDTGYAALATLGVCSPAIALKKFKSQSSTNSQINNSTSDKRKARFESLKATLYSTIRDSSTSAHIRTNAVRALTFLCEIDAEGEAILIRAFDFKDVDEMNETKFVILNALLLQRSSSAESMNFLRSKMDKDNPFAREIAKDIALEEGSDTANLLLSDFIKLFKSCVKNQEATPSAVILNYIKALAVYKTAVKPYLQDLETTTNLIEDQNLKDAILGIINTI